MTDSINLVSKYRKAIMGIATIWILYRHVVTPAFARNIDEYAAIQSFGAIFATLGVEIFLIISGIGLTYSINKHKLGTFYYHRIKRIALPFLLFTTAWLAMGSWSAEKYIGNVSGYYFFDNTEYCSLWFIPSILILYLIFPFYYKAFLKSKNKFSFTGIALLVWMMLVMVLDKYLAGDFTYFLTYSPSFFVGILIGWCGQNKKIYFCSTTYWMMVILLIPSCILTYQYFHQDYTLKYEMLAAIPSIIGACAFIFVSAKCFEILSAKPNFQGAVKFLCGFFNFFGSISFEIYIVQEWMMDVVNNSFRDKLEVWQINIITVLAAIAAAYAVNVLLSQFWKIVDGRKKKEKITA